MNRIDKLFRERKNDILSIYFTAGYPTLNSTAGIVKALADSDVDMIEIGIPFSDPLADGPVIQRSNEKALRNGMNLNLLFKQLSDIRKEVKIPLLLMGYINPVMQFGIEKFCMMCSEIAIDGVILPDLPPLVYKNEFLPVFYNYGLYNVLLISPQSSSGRISVLDKISRGFIYMVSSTAVTGPKGGFSDSQMSYFKRVNDMKLKNPCLIGFGISDRETFINAGKYARGGIIGSAFVNILGMHGNMKGNINQFINRIKSE
jgi:tryptophan synthase alpha chain